jgi:predicted amidohydrolase
MAARLLAPIAHGERCVVIGWPLGEDGRKLYSGTALFSHDGELRAVARATWVRLA